MSAAPLVVELLCEELPPKALARLGAAFAADAAKAYLLDELPFVSRFRGYCLGGEFEGTCSGWLTRRVVVRGRFRPIDGGTCAEIRITPTTGATIVMACMLGFVLIVGIVVATNGSLFSLAFAGFEVLFYVFFHAWHRLSGVSCRNRIEAVVADWSVGRTVA